MIIRKLSDNLQSYIKAGPIISDATQCALEMVFNALDAGATSVAVRVNLQKFYLQVVDNGHGMVSEDLDLIGQDHVTSKCSCKEHLECLLHTFGYRGCALAAISRTCSILEVLSRHLSGTLTLRKLILNGVPEIVEINKVVRPTHGTTVTVKDLMGSTPVRRHRMKEVFDLDDILHQLEALAIIFPDVSFSLRNDATGKVLLQTHRQGDDSKPTLAQLFGLAQNRLLVPISYHKENISISGYICRELHRDSSLQLVYVNNRIVDRSIVHKVVLALMKKFCSFWEKDRSNSDSIVDLEGYVFIVKIHIPYISFSIDRCARKSILHLQYDGDVIGCVQKAVTQCLKNDDISFRSSGLVTGHRPEENRVKGFGPSQLEGAIRGKQASRPVLRAEETHVPSRESPTDVEHVRIGSQNSVQKLEPKTRGKVTKVGVIAKSPLRGVGVESGAEGTIIPENAPIFEMQDFSFLPFHDFLAWLQVKASNDHQAKKLLSEWLALQAQSNIVYCNGPAPLVSLKQLRQERFAVWKKEMLNRIRRFGAIYKENRNKMREYREGSTLARKVRKTTTINIEARSIRNVSENIRCTAKWPQVSFNEFMGWLKLKSKYADTARYAIDEFRKFKCGTKPLQSNYCNILLSKTDSKKRKVTPGTTQTVRPSVLMTPGITEIPKNRDRPLDKERQPFCRKRKSQDDINTRVLTNSINPSYHSHYQNPTKIATPAKISQRTTAHSAAAVTPNYDPKSLECHDIFPDSQTSNDHDILVKDKSNVHIKYPPIHKPPLQPMQEDVYKEVGIQATVTTKNDFVQVSFLGDFEDKQIQTELLVGYMEKEAQTSQNMVDTHPQSLQCAQRINENVHLSEATASPVLDLCLEGSSEKMALPELPDTIPADPMWEQRTDQAGNKFFVHSVSGCTSFNPPSCSTRLSFNMLNVVGGVTQDLSGVMHKIPPLKEDDLSELKAAINDSCDDNLANVKWLAGRGGSIDKFGEEFQSWLRHSAQTARFREELGIPSGKVPKTETAVHQILSSLTFSKEQLKNAQVIGQLDKKFIVTLLSKPTSESILVCLFDQHAVDERITLECLLKQYTPEGKVASQELDSPLLVEVSKAATDLMTSCPEVFVAHGLVFSANGSECCRITAVPACFVAKAEREIAVYRVPVLKRLVYDLISETSDYVRQTRGSNLKIPTTIFNVIASQACRSAIKFNHVLTKDEMNDLVWKLSECQLPFQCAHGRPSLVPIYELQTDMLRSTKLNLRKFKKV